MKTGTVKFFNNNPAKYFGFIEGEDGDVFFHWNSGRVASKPLQGYGMPALERRGLTREPRMGDRLVYLDEPSPNHRGLRASVWAFEENYNACLPASLDSPSQNGMPSWEEMQEVVDGIIGVQQGIVGASHVLKLSNEQIAIFVRNTPDGKKGEELWKEFRRRQADKGSDEYTFITFVREVLSEAGHPITLKPAESDFDPDNDQWGAPMPRHKMSYQYD